MKVLYIFREKERKAHSIELLFDAISTEVSKSNIQIAKWYKPLSKIKSIVEVKKLKADVYHITGDCYYLALFLPKNRTIMTIHDIGMYKNHPKTWKRKLFVYFSFVLPMKRLRMATAISELTKSDLVDLLNIPAQKIKVIPNPLVFDIPYSTKEFNEIKPRILQIGTGDHKNLIGLIEAVRDIPCIIDIVGSPSQKLQQKMKEYNIEFEISSQISNEELLNKYKNCDILYFASLSEGFGLPILEAQAMGRVVITSNTEPTKSVCAAGGILVDPADYEQIRKGILILINNPNLRQRLIIQGLSNVRKYDRKSISNRYIQLYNELIHG